MRTHVPRAPRMKFKKPLQMAMDQEKPGKLFNVSESGCMVKLRHWVKVNHENHEIHFVNEKGEHLKVKGEVVRANMIPESDGIVYELGIKFNEADVSRQDLKIWLQKVPQKIDVQVKANA